jgi:uncharacterized membrane protein required for colicin V production
METIAQFISIIIIFLFALYALSGARHGFLCSCANTGSVLVSWVISANLTHVLAGNLYGSSFFSFISYLTEATDNVSNIELAKTAVASVTSSQAQQLTQYANLPDVINNLFLNNVYTQAFSGEGLYTVSEYMNRTVACVTMNIFCFVVIYIICRLIFMLVISSINFASPFYLLKNYDSIAGGVMGGIRAFMVMFVFAMFVPVLLVLVSGTEVAGIITDSPLISFFYDNNALLSLISGTIL